MPARTYGKRKAEPEQASSVNGLSCAAETSQKKPKLANQESSPDVDEVKITISLETVDW